MVCPPQAPVGESFSDQVVGLRRHAQVLLLEDDGSLVVPQGLVGESQVPVGSTLTPHASCLLGDVQGPLVPLQQESLMTSRTVRTFFFTARKQLAKLVRL